MKDFKCESEVFNGPKCKTQCEHCKPPPQVDSGREETPSRQQMEAAAKVMCDEGFEISLPWECSLDDLERHRYDTLAKAISVALALSHNGTRKET